MVRPFAALGVIVLSTACGASINAVYEGDVRFEHCMALDSEKETKPTIRRACWEEWTKFYTFGQTRDRVEYARLRMKQLSLTSDFDEGEFLASVDVRTPSAVPEPTSALAPPPMMLATDAGTPTDPADAGADADAGEEVVLLPGLTCSKTCELTFTNCQSACRVPACGATCTSKYKGCMKRCF